MQTELERDLAAVREGTIATGPFTAPDDDPGMLTHSHCPECKATVIDADDHQPWCSHFSPVEPRGDTDPS